MKYYFNIIVTYIFLLLLSISVVHAKDSAIVVFDGSGSMWGQIEGKTKIEIARDVMGTLVNDWNTNVDLGLIAYGHRKKGDCSDIEVLQPVSPIDSKRILGLINKISPKGKTPISRSLKQAAETLRYTEDSATVILVSDGEETCNADPCAVSKELEEQGINFTAHVIGFDVKNNKKALTQLKCIAANTGGQFYEADDAASLKESLIKVKEVVVDPRPAVCKPYAEDAIKHEQTNIEKECGYTGQQWTTDYTTHYDWCMSQEIGSTLPNQEHRKRVEDLNTCQTTKVKKVVIKTNIGSLELINNNEFNVSAIDQNTGEVKNTFNPASSAKQLPTGTYSLEFNHFKIDDIKVVPGETKVIDASKFVGWLTLNNNKEFNVKAINQNTKEVKGTLNPGTSAKQLPAGMYSIKFRNFTIDDIQVNPGEKKIIDASKYVGWLTLSNNKEFNVKALDQNTGKSKGILNPGSSDKQLPAGSYSIKFRNFIIDEIKVNPGETKVVDVSKFVGWLTLKNNNEFNVKAIDQNTGEEKGRLNPKASPKQLPIGTYRLKFKHHEIKDVVIEAGQNLVLKLE